MAAMHAWTIVVVALAAPLAHADSFGGFSSLDKPYLVNQDQVCRPLAVTGGTATGQPVCEQAAADVIAKLSFKPPIAQHGARASFVGSIDGKALVVSRKSSGEKVVTWKPIDPIGKIVEVYASQYDDRVAVAFTTRRMGKEVTEVVAFDLLKPGMSPDKPDKPDKPEPDKPDTMPAPVEDPKVAKAVADARKAGKAKAAVAWRAVLALDAAHGEALYQLAVLAAAAKLPAEAIAHLETLAKSTRPDAIEWLVEARFDAAFATLRADAKFRAAVGIDKKPSTIYERVMAFGGKWEQNGTSCDKPEVLLVLKRDKTFTLRIKTRCQGRVDDVPFKGKWRVRGTGLVLGLPNGGKVTAEDEAPCGLEVSGDEDALRCQIDEDLEFVALPTRR